MRVRAATSETRRFSMDIDDRVDGETWLSRSQAIFREAPGVHVWSMAKGKPPIRTKCGQGVLTVFEQDRGTDC